MQTPKLRPLSAFPVDLSEGRYICLQDPHHYVEQPVFISPETFFIVQFFDGQHSFVDIQAAFMRQYGQLLHTEHIQQIAQQLDQLLLIESPAFLAHLQQLQNEFASLPVRPSSHQGAAYPADAEQLSYKLASYFTLPKGPGSLRQNTSQTASIQAILAPHIDLEAGGAAYAWAYHALAASDATVFVILGTSHVEMKNFLAVTAKTFETSFGRIKVDRTCIETLAKHLSYDPFEDELLHKYEHSIEFQVVFLQYLFRQRPIKIVPILCGGMMHEMITLDQPLEQTPQLEESVRGLQALLQSYPNTCIIASVDFSHIGLRYGHQTRPDAQMLKKVEQLDHQLLSALAQGSPECFVAKLYQTQNATQVCGIVPMYTLLRLIEGSHGKLLHYDWVELSAGSFVSFASMVWRRKISG